MQNDDWESRNASNVVFEKMFSTINKLMNQQKWCRMCVKEVGGRKQWFCQYCSLSATPKTICSVVGMQSWNHVCKVAKNVTRVEQDRVRKVEYCYLAKRCVGYDDCPTLSCVFFTVTLQNNKMYEVYIPDRTVPQTRLPINWYLLIIITLVVMIHSQLVWCI